MRQSIRVSLLIILLLICTASSGRSQVQGPNRKPVTVDTSSWRPLTTYVIAQIAPYIARAASDTASVPWIIAISKDYPKSALFERHLRVVLRARDRTPLDDHYYELRLNSPVISGDTMYVRFETGFTQLCSNPAERPGGFGNVDEAYLVRRKLAEFRVWSAVVSKGVMHGDRFGCRK